MNGQGKKAKIYWRNRTEGGRTKPPSGLQYVTVARFEDEKDKWPEEAWSLVLEFDTLPDESLISVATVSFLVEDAPHHLLHVGSRFELFEGHKCVADGEVIEEHS